MVTRTLGIVAALAALAAACDASPSPQSDAGSPQADTGAPQDATAASDAIAEGGSASACSTDAACDASSSGPADSGRTPDSAGPPPTVSNKGLNATGGTWLLLSNLTSANLKAVIEDFVAMGVGWVRWEMDADVIDSSCGALAWGNNDAVIAALHAAGIRIMALLNQAPNCMTAQGAPVTQGPTDSMGWNAWASFAGAVAKRYGATGSACAGCIQAYELWNEPNCGQFWTPDADPASLVGLAKAAYPAIKAADSAAIVVVGALAPCGTSGTHTIDEEQFLADLYGAGLHGSEDAISDHPYTQDPVGTIGSINIQKLYDTSTFPGTGATCAANGTPDNCTLTNIMAAGGDGAEQIWTTEFGWPVSAAGGGGQSLDQTQVASDIGQYYAILSKYKSSWAGPGFWYNYQNFVTATGTGPDGKPQCTASDDPSGEACYGLELQSPSGVGAPTLGRTAYTNATF